MHRRFRIGPPQVSLNLLPPEFHRRGFLLTFAIMKEKQHNNLFEIEWELLVHTIFPCFCLFPLDEHSFWDCYHILADTFGIQLLLLMFFPDVYNSVLQGLVRLHCLTACLFVVKRQRHPYILFCIQYCIELVAVWHYTVALNLSAL